jgi:hypothetical protein
MAKLTEAQLALKRIIENNPNATEDELAELF